MVLDGQSRSQWVTARRDTYAALVRAGLLPPTIRFHEIRWDTRYGASSTLLPYILNVERVPKNRKRPQRVYLFDLWRHDREDTLEREMPE